MRVREWLPAVITFSALLITYVCIPTNCGVPKFNLTQELTQPAPLDPQRLYLSIYPPPEIAYRMESWPGSFGSMVRPGSTSMWGGVHFINGYSPIRPSGLAREFDCAIHGEIPPEKAASLLQREAGPDGLLARLGIDGIIVANESGVVPAPDYEWHVSGATSEGRIFHRWESLPAVRSIPWIDSRPNEQFASAEISRIDQRRNRLGVDVAVPAGGSPALLTVSRPFFPGYRAEIGGRSLKVDSYRGLIPLIEVPPGTNGRVTLVYRPAWLVWGSGISILCVAIVAVAGLLAIWQTRRPRAPEPRFL